MCGKNLISFGGCELNHLFELQMMNSNLRRIMTLINKQKHLHVVAKTSTKRSKSQDPSIALQVHYNKMSFTSFGTETQLEHAVVLQTH